MNRPLRGVSAIFANHQPGRMDRLLSRIVLAYHLHGGKISFAGKDRPNFVDKALHRLRPHTDGVHSVIDEPMVVEAVEEDLNATGEDPTSWTIWIRYFRLSPTLGLPPL